MEKIKKVNTTEKFYFLHVSGEKVQKFIMNLNGSKASSVGDIPTEML